MTTTDRIPFHNDYRRIATEEAFAPPEMLRMYRELYDSRTLEDPGFDSLWGFYLTSSAPRPRSVREKLADVGAERIADMDAAGIDHQIISLTSPGVQVFPRDTAVSLARDSNDFLHDALTRHPDRFSGLCAIAPQAPELAAQELERCVKLGFKGIINNSHTFGEYLSDPKFWPIFEAAEAMDMPIYLHPYTPPKSMIGPLLDVGLDGAIFGFGVETGMHLLRIITAGVFDRFPRLQMIVGHMGEALPYWLYRLDYMHAATVRAQRYESMPPIKRKVSDYLRDNVYITNSGVAWEPAIKFAQEVIGLDRVMYAMDYPYQHTPQEVLDLDAMDMPLAHKRKFYQEVAEKVFKLV
ncbi:MAG TPA: amidohydrolase family protein [Hyphomicrobiales bacterium]|nr:amidohydrolase family protein [Hyphomicrobiales bacterium]